MQENNSNAYKCQVRPEFLGMHALNMFALNDSPSRLQMFGSHFAQRLPLENAEERLIQSGIEREFADNTFSIKVNCNARIIRTLLRYPPGVDKNSLPFNPEIVVIFENLDKHLIDCISIPYYGSYHQFFGFPYKKTEACSQIKPNAYIEAGTILADSPSVAENKGLKYGVNLNVALTSHPTGAEDGIKISRTALEKMKFYVYETRVIEFGSKNFPLNLYGDKDNYQPFPEIGQYVRKDKLLMMLRNYSSLLAPVMMSIHDTREPDYFSDRGIYLRDGQGRVIDIKVVRSNASNRNLPEAMCAYLDRYEFALRSFYTELLSVRRQLVNDHKAKFGTKKINISPKLQQMLVMARAIADPNGDMEANRSGYVDPNKRPKHPLNLNYRKAPIDEYRVEITVEYLVTPGIGNKITDTHGGKGVIVDVAEPEDMPVDIEGNVADIATDFGATVNRMIPGRLYELYISAAVRDARNRMLKRYNITRPLTMEDIEDLPPATFDEMYQYLLNFYRIINEEQYQCFNALSDVARREHLLYCLNHQIVVNITCDHIKHPKEIVKDLEKSPLYRPVNDKVTYVGESGNRVVTEENIRVGVLYIMLLEKIADDWSSVSYGKLQPFGTLSPMTRSEKFANPFRYSSVRFIGETEGRIISGYCGRECIAEMRDRSNNPLTQRHMVYNVLSAQNPSNIHSVVDRNQIPLGNDKPLQLVRHIFLCAGFKPTYIPERKRDPRYIRNENTSFKMISHEPAMDLSIIQQTINEGLKEEL